MPKFEQAKHSDGKNRVNKVKITMIADAMIDGVYYGKGVEYDVTKGIYNSLKQSCTLGGMKQYKGGLNRAILDANNKNNGVE